MSQRLDKDRYAVEGPWTQQVCGPSGETLRGVLYYRAGLLDKRLGHVWDDGAHRVKVLGPSKYRSATFYGETAWSDAARLIDDVAWEQRQQGRLR